MQIFDRPQRMKVYSDGSFRFVSNEKINEGDDINVGSDYMGNNVIMRKVDKIIEERKSRGVFKNESERPYSYHLTAK